MMIYLRNDEIDLKFDDADPLQLVAEMEKAVRRHGITLTDVGVDSRYLDAGLDHNDSAMIELGACRGNHLKKLIRILNAAPVEDEPASEETTSEEAAAEFCQTS
ncbi:hypothetical protein [Streptomyces sp. NBRC 109706]|uniref:hypothetical protein n=1 Tax=Streptomyces sp. NBRC 109706 TaxID=1550035 RepID=UPI0007852436|nr:hypothetical protein [Streptomyces sp. NBRC 109706]